MPPLLFTTVMEGLNSMMRIANHNRWLKGFRVWKYNRWDVGDLSSFICRWHNYFLWCYTRKISYLRMILANFWSHNRIEGKSVKTISLVLHIGSGKHFGLLIGESTYYLSWYAIGVKTQSFGDMWWDHWKNREEVSFVEVFVGKKS